MSTIEAETIPAVLPYTGDEYLESLRDGREVWLNGERVADVTTHPAFRNSARSVARLYDALHNPAYAGRLTRATDTGNNGFTHPAFVTARSRSDLRASRDASRVWAELSFGWMGRTPDYKASMLSALGADPDWYGEYRQNAVDWYTFGQERIPYLGHAVINPPLDRSRAADENPDVIVHVEKETDNGVIVSGAKVVATGSPLTHHVFVSHFGAAVHKREYALVFFAPISAPGVKLLARNSYELNAAKTGSPFDYPLSSRLDENDAVIIFDQALIPWENVLVYDLDQMAGFHAASGWAPRAWLQSATRMCVKLEFLIGLTSKALEIKGGADSPGLRAALGEMVAIRNTVAAMADGMIEGALPCAGGSAVLPNTEYGLAYVAIAPRFYRRVKEIIQTIVASGLIYLNSSVADFATPGMRPYLDRFMRGSGDITALERSKTMKLLWDAIGTEFGGRHELYELNYSASPEANHMQSLSRANKLGHLDSYRALADAYMADYDENGWLAADMIAAGEED